MKKIGIVVLLLIICILSCSLTACWTTYRGTVSDSRLEQYGFRGLEIINNKNTKYHFNNTSLYIETNIDGYDEYKAYCEYIFSYVNSVEGVVVAGSVESDWGSSTIVDEFKVHDGHGLDEGYVCYNEYAYTTHEIGEDGELSLVFDITVRYNPKNSGKDSYNFEIALNVMESQRYDRWYYKGDKV